MFKSGNMTLIISNEETNDIIKIIMSNNNGAIATSQGRNTIRADEDTFRADEETSRASQNFQCRLTL